MLVLLIVGFVVTILGAIPALIIQIFPSMSVSTLPFGIDSILVQGMSYFKFLITVFPPFGVLWEALLLVIGFKILLKLIAMIPIVRGLLHK